MHCIDAKKENKLPHVDQVIAHICAHSEKLVAFRLAGFIEMIGDIRIPRTRTCAN